MVTRQPGAFQGPARNLVLWFAMAAMGQSRRFDDVRDVSASPSTAAEPPNRYITANRRDRSRPEILCRLWGWWRLPTDGLPRLAGAGFNPSCKDDPGRFVGEGAGRDVNTFGPVFYLARTDTRCWTAGLGGNTLRGCAELRAVVARCRARSPVQFRAAPVASALPPQRRALFPLRSRRAFRSRRCPGDHWPVA